MSLKKKTKNLIKGNLKKFLEWTLCQPGQVVILVDDLKGLEKQK